VIDADPARIPQASLTILECCWQRVALTHGGGRHVGIGSERLARRTCPLLPPCSEPRALTWISRRLCAET
jgi:hypothetical protein